MTFRPAESDVLVPMWSNGRRPPLFCVHGGSGSSLAYAALARELGSDQPLYAFEAPGFDNDRLPVDSLARLADEYAATIRGATAPYHLLGWSLGGALAFEMALRLIAAGGQIGSLILLDSAVPQRYDNIDERTILYHFLGDLTGGLYPDELDSADVPGGRSDADLAIAVFDRIASSGVLGPEVDLHLLRRRYAVFRANVIALHSHEPSGFFPGRITLITAKGTPPEHVDWSNWASAVDRHPVDATHHDLLRQPAIAEVGRIVRSLDRAAGILTRTERPRSSQ